jgi:MFS family permease
MDSRKDRKTDLRQSTASLNRRNFTAGLWHGAFMTLGVSLTQPTIVISAFVADLTGSTIWVGGLMTVLTVAGAIPQLFVARLIEPRPRKMPYLLIAIYLRVISWGILAWSIYIFGEQDPIALAGILVGMLVIFYAGGGLGNIPYTDIIGKIIPPNKRGAFYGGKGVLAGPLSVGAAFAARHILANVPYPNNYALLFGIAAVGLAIASIGFLVIREPIAKKTHQKPQSWPEFRQHLLVVSRKLKPLITVQILTGFSLMVLPFYVVYAREQLGAPMDAVGWFLLAQVLGGSLSNFVWAHLVDTSGSRRMLFICAVISAIKPLFVIVLGSLSWMAMLPIFFFAGAVFNGRKVGFQSALLEVSPTAERSSYAGLNAVLTLPVAFLSLLAGLLLQYWSYTALFFIASIFIGLGAVVIRRWSLEVDHTN